jgi:hypothetical protein
MVLHLSVIESKADAPEILTPALGDWIADTNEQIIAHVESGCRFHAYPMQREGPIVPPFAAKQIAVRFLGMQDRRPPPSLEVILRLGTQGILWAVTYTLASRST